MIFVSRSFFFSGDERPIARGLEICLFWNGQRIEGLDEVLMLRLPQPWPHHWSPHSEVSHC